MRFARQPFCIGNHPKEARPLLEQAIAETGFPAFIKDEATDLYGHSVSGCISLWSKVLDDTQPLFDVYHRLKAEQEA